jgi:hypothetical protein
MEDITHSDDVERVRRQRAALQRALPDSQDFEPLWVALTEYRDAADQLEALEDADDYSPLLPMAMVIEGNARFCLAVTIDLHASRVAFTAQKALMDLAREEA